MTNMNTKINVAAGASLANTTLTSGTLINSIYASTVTTATGGVSGNWATYNNLPQVLRVEGDAEFKGEVTIKGVKLDERLTAIEERLGILRHNNDLEGRWEKLKSLGDEYRSLEKDILEKEKIWDLIKK
jgi:hypothetical protein